MISVVAVSATTGRRGTATRTLREGGTGLYRTPPSPGREGAGAAPGVPFGAPATRYAPMFENLRRSLRDLLDSPAAQAGGASLSQMRETLVQARLGIGEMREGVEQTRLSLAAKERELETVRRRKQQAEAIGDAETVRVAERYESELASRVEVLRRKLGAQEDELALGERELGEMTAELRKAIGGGVRRPAAAIDPLADEQSAALDELAALERARGRAARSADAEAKLAELKRKMGK